VKAGLSLLLAALFLVGGAVWLRFGDGPGTKAPPVVTPGRGETGGQKEGEQPPSAEQMLKARAAEILPLMKAGNLGALAAYVHPAKGVRFSPYLYAQASDRVHQAAQLSGAMGDQTVYTWGAFDGSGEPMNLTFKAYWNRFVWNRDYTTATQVAVDQRLGKGNALDNTAQAYPGARWVEYHFPGTEQYGGMDWTSLRLIFAAESGTWYLVGISHDQWTI
jgi:hypothetical protein